MRENQKRFSYWFSCFGRLIWKTMINVKTLILMVKCECTADNTGFWSFVDVDAECAFSVCVCVP